MTDNPFWDFSLTVYARPGVPAACLDLQDRRGLDVNVLLFAAWAGMACGVRLSAEELARVDSAVEPWRGEVVRPLRAVRRRVKGEDAALYEQLKAAELAAERIQQDRLFAVSGLTPAPGDRVESGRVELGVELAAANLRLLVPGNDPALEVLIASLRDG
jgi:TIGR02444 family protein